MILLNWQLTYIINFIMEEIKRVDDGDRNQLRIGV